MRFFHTSPLKLTQLIPTLGAARHGGEDERAVEKAVVWLSNESMVTFKKGVPDTYQYEVDIDINDPELFMDELFDEMQRTADEIFKDKKKSAMRWYFYLKPVDVIVVRTYDPKTNTYV